MSFVVIDPFGLSSWPLQTAGKHRLTQPSLKLHNDLLLYTVATPNPLQAKGAMHGDAWRYMFSEHGTPKRHFVLHLFSNEHIWSILFSFLLLLWSLPSKGASFVWLGKQPNWNWADVGCRTESRFRNGKNCMSSRSQVAEFGKHAHKTHFLPTQASPMVVNELCEDLYFRTGTHLRLSNRSWV